MTELHIPDDVLYSLKRGAQVTIHLRISYSRYRGGEAVIETVYRQPGGYEETAPASRIFLGNARYKVITELWDKLFDAVLVARQYDVENIIIKFHCATTDEWNEKFLTACTIVAYELNVMVSSIQKTDAVQG